MIYLFENPDRHIKLFDLRDCYKNISGRCCTANDRLSFAIWFLLSVSELSNTGDGVGGKPYILKSKFYNGIRHRTILELNILFLYLNNRYDMRKCFLERCEKFEKMALESSKSQVHNDFQECRERQWRIKITSITFSQYKV